MTFTNECGCIFDEKLLAKAVDTYCRRENVYCKQNHRITMHNRYPTITINRKHITVHDLLRRVLWKTRAGFVVHHKDFNRLNNSVENLAYITSSAHSKIHSNHNWSEVRSGRKTMVRGDGRRKDIDDDEIRKMRQDGLTAREIANIMKCHPHTIYNRIEKMKEKDNKTEYVDELEKLFFTDTQT